MPGKDRRRQRERDKVQRELKTLPQQELARLIQTLEEEMHEAAAELKFEYAARLTRRSQRPATRVARRWLAVAPGMGLTVFATTARFAGRVANSVTKPGRGAPTARSPWSRAAAAGRTGSPVRDGSPAAPVGHTGSGFPRLRR